MDLQDKADQGELLGQEAPKDQPVVFADLQVGRDQQDWLGNLARWVIRGHQEEMEVLIYLYPLKSFLELVNCQSHKITKKSISIGHEKREAKNIRATIITVTVFVALIPSVLNASDYGITQFIKVCTGLIAPDTLIRDNIYPLLMCQNGTKTNIQAIF